MHLSSRSLLLAVGIFVAAVPNAWAQEQRLRLSTSVSQALGDGGSALAVGVAAGLQFMPRAGIEWEILHISGQDLVTGRGGQLQTFPPIAVSPQIRAGSTTAFVTSLVTDMQIGRVHPYAQFGGGVGSVRWKSRGGLPGVGLAPVSSSGSTEQSVIIGTATTGPVLAMGGGLDARVSRHLSIGADLRYIRLFGNPASNGVVDITRVGGRVGYRF